MKFDYLFSQIILQEQISRGVLFNIKKEIEVNFDEINKLLVGNVWRDNIYTTSKYCKCIISHFNWVSIKNVIDPLIKNYLSETKIPYQDFNLLHSWINIATPGGFQELHIHGQNIISGCLYLNTSDNCGEIEFQPHIYETTHKANIAYTPSNGEILIFHGMTPHRVIYNKSEKNRISLSFNYSYTLNDLV
jgi:uncharacterized protein (TIGR02466 family)